MPSSSSSSDDEDWSRFAQAAVSVEQVAVEQAKIAKQGQQRLTKLSVAPVTLPAATPGSAAAGTAADGAPSTSATIVHGHGEVKAESWRNTIEPVQQLGITEKKIGAALDKILDESLKFKTPKAAKSKSKKQKGKHDSCGGGSDGDASYGEAGSTARDGGPSTSGRQQEQDPNAQHLDLGVGIRLFRRTRAGLPVLERTEAYYRLSGGPRIKAADLLEAVRVKRARLDAADAAAPDEAGADAEAGGGSADKRARKEAKAARKAEKAARKAREAALAVMAMDGAAIAAGAQAAAVAEAARSGLVMPQPLVAAGPEGDGAGSSKKKSKQSKAAKLVPAPGTVVEAKAWVPYEERTATLLGIKA
mmetsp:Transcript_28801/g.73429  ORF Transcript_28801/g.73429 Transcript_28801/m.73429 type:complete len:361 (-) Transcript_28801:460-1542(-)